jgi:biopolymer transport protein ExbD
VSGNRRPRRRRSGTRLAIVGAVGIMLVVLLIFGITSCVRGCTSSQQEATSQEQTDEEESDQPVNEKDKRVAYGIDAETTAKLGQVLDRDESFAYLAAHADKIEDARLIDLALAEPEAVSFVAGAVDATGATQAFGASIPQGEYPTLYTFDTRWGYAPYADGMIGSIGSGPVAISMASMGLTGQTTQDPATVAALISAANAATGVSGMDETYLLEHLSDVGLAAAVADPSSEGMYIPLVENLPVIARVRENSGIGSNLSHWILITKLNDDNSISLNDPTSAIASSHSWSLGAVAAQTEAAYQISISYNGTAPGGSTAGIASGVQPQEGDNAQGTTSEDGTTDDSYADQSYSDQTYTDDSYTDQTSTDESYVDQGSTDQGYTDQGYTDQTYAEESTGY